jgi:hypothetical protein
MGEHCPSPLLHPPLTPLQRIDRIQSTLSSDLDHLFASTLLTLIFNPAKGKEKDKAPIITTEGEKAKLTADLTECLRTYDVLGLWRDAEDVIRREVVRAFVKKVSLGRPIFHAWYS